MTQQSRQKAIWVHKDYFDQTPDRVTWIEMINNLASLGWELTLVTVFRREKIPYPMAGSLRYIPSVKIPYLNMLSSLFFIYGYIVYRILRRDVSHVILDYASFWCSFPFDLLARLGLVKVTFVVDWRTFHFGELSQTSAFRNGVSKAATYIALRYSKLLHTGVSVITESMRDIIVSWVGFDPQRICIWSSGVNTALFSPQPKDAQRVQKLGLQGKFVVMYHGVLTAIPNRGLAEAVQAMALVKAKHPQVRLVFLGNGPAEQDLRALIQELSLASEVLLLPTVPYQEAPGYVNLGDIGIMAYPNSDYWRLNNPIKLLEYLSLEKPVIVRDMVTFRSVVDGLPGALFLPDNDPQTIANAISKAYEDRKSLLAAGSKGRELVLQRYTWAQQAFRLDAFLRKEMGIADESLVATTPAVERAPVPAVEESRRRA